MSRWKMMFLSLQRKYTCRMKQHLISVSWNSDKSPSEMFLLSLLQISHYWGRDRRAAVQILSLPLPTFLVFTGTLLLLLEAFSCSWAGKAFSCSPSYFTTEPLQAAVQIPFAVLLWLSQSQAGRILALETLEPYQSLEAALESVSLSSRWAYIAAWPGKLGFSFIHS